MSLETELMSVHDVAEVLGVDRSRINVLLKQGRFEGAAKIGRNWVVPRASVKTFRRLPPGGRKGTKQRKEEDKALVSDFLEAVSKTT